MLRLLQLIVLVQQHIFMTFFITAIKDIFKSPNCICFAGFNQHQQSFYQRIYKQMRKNNQFMPKNSKREREDKRATKKALQNHAQQLFLLLTSGLYIFYFCLLLNIRYSTKTIWFVAKSYQIQMDYIKSYLMKKFKLAVLQTRCVANKLQNITYITDALQTAGKNGANVSVLGQICNSPYVKKYMHEFAQDFSDSPTLQAIQQQCSDFKMYAVGSIPRRKDDKYFNTAFVINPQGKLQQQYDKLHLFDIDIPGKITYKESQTFTQGSKVCVFQTQYCTMGLAICYDLRFAELGLLMRQKGATVLLYPGSFNQTTGPLHWELLLRARALDNQCYTVGVSVAQFKQDPTIYQAWAHSTVVDPFGKVLVALDENPAIAYYDVDPNYASEVRQNIPVSKQKRHDIYKLQEVL